MNCGFRRLSTLRKRVVACEVYWPPQCFEWNGIGPLP